MLIIMVTIFQQIFNIIFNTYSKILEHSLNFGHSIHDNNFKILDNPHNFDLRILESFWIHKLKPSLNDRSSSTELSIVC